MADGLRLASLFPHYLSGWNARDAKQVQTLLEHSQTTGIDPGRFLESVAREFAQLCAYFEPQGQGKINLAELLTAATREAADCTTRLVGTVQELMRQAIQAGNQVNKIIEEHSRLEEAIHRDPLTGALNREGLHIKTALVLKKAARYGNGLAVTCLDLDHFKTLNDTRGHHWGDAALKAVVDSLHAQLRETDLVARMGGDEFVIVVNDCGQKHVEHVLERVLKQLAATPLGQDDGTGPQVTISAGLLWVQPGQEQPDLDKLITAADHLMYNAKRAGGNRICKGTVSLAT